MFTEEIAEQPATELLPSARESKPAGTGRQRVGFFEFKRFRAVLLTSAGIATVLYCCLCMSLPPEPVPRPFSFGEGSSWITTNATGQSTGCFRLELPIPHKIKNAWLAVSTNGGFEVIANGQSRARIFAWRRTHSFQTSLSEGGQRLTPGDSTMSVNFPREYQWSDHDYAELPTWVDLTTFLHPGINSLCVEVETDGTQPVPAFIMTGEVLLEDGEKIPIQSNSAWAAEPVPKKLPQYGWTDPKAFVHDWAHAKTLPWKRAYWRLFARESFSEPFRGEPIRSPSGSPITWIEKDVDLARAPAEGYLRVMTDSLYQVWINDHLVKPITRNTSVLGHGPWFLRDLGRIPMDVNLDAEPEWLDPNSVATLLPGQQRETPPTPDPAVNDPSPDQARIAGTPQHPIGNDFARGTGTRKMQGLSPYADLTNPDHNVPPALTRDRRTVEFEVYSVDPLLHSGHNKIRIGLYRDDPEGAGLSWQPFLAFDGGAKSKDGQTEYFGSDSQVRGFAGANGKITSINTAIGGVIAPSLLPPKRFFGYVYPYRPWFSLSAVIFTVAFLVLISLATLFRPVGSFLTKVETASGMIAAWIVAGVILRSAMLERSEALYWRFPEAWFFLLLFGLIGGVVGIILQRGYQKRRRARAEEVASGISQGNRSIFESRWVVFAGLVLCFALRAWQIDLQPPDEDEYVSIQASMAVAKMGVPQFQPGVWYTRSPAYHYLAGAVAFLTGNNIYSLRLIAVFFSCLIALLVWRMAKEMTGNYFLAFCAMMFIVIHPFQIFTGHVARFYQMQQYFSLLTYAYFLRGFIGNTGMKDRYLTVFIFLVSVLSQEISLLTLPPLLACYFIFGQKRRWPDEIRIMVASGCAVALIALDIAFFKIECMTALDGLSPRVDASVGWAFDKIPNFLVLFIGYSRLHLVLSAFLLPGFIMAWRRRKILWSCTYVYFVLNLIVTNMLITSRGYRFEYFLIPIWILLCVHGMGETAKILIPNRENKGLRTALAFGWFIVVLISWSPWRILKSYHTDLQADPTRALRYVAQNLRPSDKVAISELYPQASLIETGRTDYDIAIPILYDFAVRKQGKLVDRNAAATVVGNLDELQRAFAQNDRLWIVFDKDQMHARGKNILWEYPAARVQLFLQTNAHLVFRSHLWSVYLWDKNNGEYSTFSEQPGNWFE